ADAEEDFIFKDGFYPCLRDEIESEGGIFASPILLYPGENADSVSMPFYVDTNYGVRWRSTNEGIIRIEGNIGYVRHPVLKETTVRVGAWNGWFNKHVYLTVPASHYVYQDLKADTVCPGDSVKMISSYAKNKGWNYELVETASAEYDTIYRMNLHHYPTYREVVHRAAVERDSLPYILGKDTIRNFGLTELHRYQTVHGCDSITYVRLDTLYIHREQHFYDTLHTCEGGALSWRGREIAQTGEYADTVFDPYKGGTDSIYHLRADIYPTYKEVMHRASVERDSLPYIFGKDTIWNFGLTELNRYQTVHGCDSVTYVQLDTLYIHRSRHFYDTLHTCEGGALSWRGREITQTGEYADTVFDPYKGGTDSIYHLRAFIYPVYHLTFTDSCYIEDLPYTVGDRVFSSFGACTDSLITVAGCDSVRKYVLSRRWRHYRVQVSVRGEGSVNVTDTVLREDGSLWLAFTASACNKLA
ncbi:MAG: hypothetical protein K2O37_07250, partial [Bacteroidales bacterium]|nr:hypothetical protein [Bacteroidales bacterium]